MEEITFSVFNHGQAATENLVKLLKQFELLFGIRVRLEVIQTWMLGWSRLVENALYRNGPDISEAGNTWIGDLARMDALYPFNPDDVIELTKDAHLFENLWRSRTRDESGKPIVYSIPWTGDTRAVFYRRDLLEKSGVDEANAFIDNNQFERTLCALEKGGVTMPLAITTLRSSLTIHYIASWIWSAGGDFLTPDGEGLAFHQSRALEGCKAYFRLGRHLRQDDRNLAEDGVNQAFSSGRSAVTPNGYWILSAGGLVPEVSDNLGLAPMPGVPFVGGQDLVTWNHSRHKSAVMKLIKFLHSEEAGKELFPLYGLPVSETAWESPPFNSGLYPIFKTAIQTGRGFHGPLWGLVEKRLTDEFADIWTEIMKSPDNQLDTIVDTHMKNLAERLQLSMVG